MGHEQMTVSPVVKGLTLETVECYVIFPFASELLENLKEMCPRYNLHSIVYSLHTNVSSVYEGLKEHTILYMFNPFLASNICKNIHIIIMLVTCITKSKYIIYTIIRLYYFITLFYIFCYYLSRISRSLKIINPFPDK